MSTDAAADTPIDATMEVITPENIAVHYRVAGPIRRALAFSIDLAVFTALAVVIILAMNTFATISRGLAEGLLAVSLFVLQWFFFSAQEFLLGGRTLGKWILGLRVLTVDGQPINALQAIMRALLRAPNYAVPMVDLLAMSLNDRFQRLGDIACGTVVVFDDRSWLFGVAKLEDPRAVQLATYLPPDFEVTKSLAKALSTYVERRRFFSPPRRREVARHLAEPLLRKLGLPADTSSDLLLCALYYRAFIADSRDDERHAAEIAAQAQRSFGSPKAAEPSVSVGGNFPWPVGYVPQEMAPQGAGAPGSIAPGSSAPLQAEVLSPNFGSGSSLRGLP
jgi:uncharacterized RDD family membrane protein YckC